MKYDVFRQNADFFKAMECIIFNYSYKYKFYPYPICGHT